MYHIITGHRALNRFRPALPCTAVPICCTWNMLSSPHVLLQILFPCISRSPSSSRGLVASTVVPAGRCCHHFVSMCDQANSIFFFSSAPALFLRHFSSTVLCWIFCLVSVHLRYFAGKTTLLMSSELDKKASPPWRRYVVLSLDELYTHPDYQRMATA